MCFVLYYYQVINLVISDLKTSKSLISNARPGLRVEWKCPTPGMCFMHLSMLGRQGGRRGKGAGFDGKVYPVSGEFDNHYSPGGRGI